MARSQTESSPFGAQLRAYRLAAGLSQETLAEMAGLSPNAIGALERGARKAPYPDTFRRLADALALTAEQRRTLQLTFAPVDVATADPVPSDSLNVAMRTNVRPDPTSFIGRDDDLGILRGYIERGQRLVTLTGPGGVGKTRLASELARSLTGHFPDGAWFVDLSPVGDAERARSAFVEQLAPLGLSGPDPQLLAADLRRRRCLVVIDNVEQVAGFAPVIGHLLRETEGLVFVVTSRAPLRIRAEQVYPVEPLRQSQGDAADERESGPAFTLFVDRARALAPGFSLDDDRAAMVSAICRHVDGIPLAIELAAARTPHVPLAVLLARLQEGLDAYGTGMRDAPERQRTMRSAIGWSVDALGAEQRELFAMLSVFQGGCDYGMAEELFHTLRPVSGRSFVDLASGLLDAGLATMVPGTGNAPDRLRLLEPIRAYAAEILDGDARVQATRGHAALFRQLAIQAAPRLQGAGQVGWLGRLVSEQYNVDRALATLVEEGNLAWAVDILWHLWRFWWLAGLQLPTIRWLERILELAAATPGALDPDRLGQAQVCLGSFTWAIGNDALAVDALRRGAALAAEAGDERAQAIGLVTLALTDIRAGDLDTAEGRLDAALALPLVQRDPALRAWATAYTGVIAMLSKRYGDAQTRLETSLRDGEMGDDRQAISESCFYLGLLGFRRGNPRFGMELLVAGLAAAESVAEPVMIGYYLKALALGFEAFGETGDDLAHAGDELLARRTAPWYMDHLFREAASDLGRRRPAGALPGKEGELPLPAGEAIAAARRRGAGVLASAEPPPSSPPRQ